MKITYNELIEILNRIGFKTMQTMGTNVFLKYGKLNIIITLPLEKRDNIYDSVNLDQLLKQMEEHQIITKEKFAELAEEVIVKI